MAITFDVPIRTSNPLNSGNWGNGFAQDRKRKAEKAAVYRRMPAVELDSVLVVRMVRRSNGTLDDDGLRAALKSVRDAIAKRLGVDDGTQLVRWLYEQEKGSPMAVTVTISGAIRNGTAATKPAKRNKSLTPTPNFIPSGPLAEEKEGGT